MNFAANASFIAGGTTWSPRPWTTSSGLRAPGGAGARGGSGRRVGADLFVVVGAVDAERPFPADEVGDRRLRRGGRRPGRRRRAAPPASRPPRCRRRRRGRCRRLSQPPGLGAGRRDGAGQVVERVVEVVGDEARRDGAGPGQRLEERVVEEERAAVDQQQVRRPASRLSPTCGLGGRARRRAAPARGRRAARDAAARALRG